MTPADRIRAIIAKCLDADPDTVKDGCTVEELGGDSLHAVDIVLAIEDEFGIELDDADLHATSTVSDFIVTAGLQLQGREAA